MHVSELLAILAGLSHHEKLELLAEIRKLGGASEAQAQHRGSQGYPASQK